MSLPALRQKAFTIDEANRRAGNVYLWDSERLSGVRPRVSFVEVADLVDNR